MQRRRRTPGNDWASNLMKSWNRPASPTRLQAILPEGSSCKSSGQACALQDRQYQTRPTWLAPPYVELRRPEMRNARGGTATPGSLAVHGVRWPMLFRDVGALAGE